MIIWEILAISEILQGWVFHVKIEIPRWCIQICNIYRLPNFLLFSKSIHLLYM